MRWQSCCLLLLLSLGATLPGWALMDTVMTDVIRLGYPVRAVVGNEEGQIWILTARGLEKRLAGDTFELVDPGFQQMPCIVDGAPQECTRDGEFREAHLFNSFLHWRTQFAVNTGRYTAAADASGAIWVCTGAELYTFELRPVPKRHLKGESIRGVCVDDSVVYANSYSGWHVGEALKWATRDLHAGNIITWKDTLYSFCHGMHQWPGRKDAERGDLYFAEARPMQDSTWLFSTTSLEVVMQGIPHRDTLWVCGQNGLGHWDGKAEIVPLLEGVNVSGFAVVHEELFAFLRWGGVMVRDEGGQFTAHPDLPQELTYHDALALRGVTSAPTSVAFATDRGIGIWDMKSGDFNLISIRDGLPSNMICGLAQDAWGHLWASTYAGLVRLSLTHGYVDAFLPQVEFNRFAHHFDAENGVHFWGAIDGLYETRLDDFPKPKIQTAEASQDEALVPSWLLPVALLVALFVIVAQSLRSRSLLKRAAQSEEELFFQRLESIVISRLPDLSVDQLADASGISLRTLYRRMEEYGVKPGEFVRNVRVRRAKALMAENEGMGMAEAAREVGYSEAHLQRLLGPTRNPSD